MKSVLITGANGGIGARAVQHFLDAGWTVFATDRTVEGATQPQLHRLALDVTSEASVSQAVAQVGALLGEHRLDVLVNNAGLGLLGPIAEFDEGELRQMFEVNVLGVLRVTRAFAPQLCERGGRVVNVGSLAGLVTLPFFGGYSASKYAVEALTDALRLELGAFAVKVSLIEPAIVGTAFVASCLRSLEAAAARGSRWAHSLRHTSSLSRWLDWVHLSPDAVAKVMVRAASSRWPRARYRVGALSSCLLRVLGALPWFLTDASLRRVLALRRPRAALLRPDPVEGR